MKISLSKIYIIQRFFFYKVQGKVNKRAGLIPLSVLAPCSPLASTADLGCKP
jgi:hypothetical protein